MGALNPRAYDLPPGIVDEMYFGWTHSEENELFEGIMFFLDRSSILGAEHFHQLIVEVASFLQLTLKKKANVDLIRWKLRHMCDTYRHFKKFIFEKPGVSFNLQTNTAKIGPLYWKCTGEESELYAFFRTHGLRSYRNCWNVFDNHGLDQFASYIDEDVRKKIPLGLDPQFLTGFYYFRHRVTYPRLNKTQRAMCYRDCKVVNDDDLDMYFFTNDWDIEKEGEFVIKVEQLLQDRNINTQEKFDILVDDLFQFYFDPDDIQYSEVGIREKLRSLAYNYQLFKRFLFETVGVEYNIYNCVARVDDTYWECSGKEPQYKGFFRINGFHLYESCYNLFDVKGLARFAHGKHPIDPVIPEGADLSSMSDEDVFKSYHRT